MGETKESKGSVPDPKDSKDQTPDRLGQEITLRASLTEVLSHEIDAVTEMTAASGKSLIKVRRDMLVEAYTDWRENWAKILVVPGFEASKQRAAAKTANNVLSDKYAVAIAYLDDLHQPILESTLLEQTSRNTNALTNIKLPPIKLKQFNGEYSEWEEFRDSFLACFGGELRISKCQQFLYLRSCLGEEPASLIKNLQTTDETFDQAWQLLEKRYSNKRRLVYSHYRKIVDLPDLKREDARDVRTLSDTATASFAAIKLHDKEVGQLDEFVVFLLAQKLDANSRKHWEEHLKATTSLPRFETLKDFLEMRFNILDGLKKEPASISQDHNKMASPKKANSPRNFHMAIKKTLKCTLCSGAHRPFECELLKLPTLAERKRLVESKSLCFNCLYQHATTDCKSKYSCLICKKRHHVILHDHDEPQAIVAHVSHTRTALLATAKVRITTDAGSSLVVRALIDQGSSINLITERVVQQLRAPRQKSMTAIVTVGNQNTVQTKHKVQTQLHSLYNSFHTNIDALVIQRITDVVSSREAIASDWPHLNGLELADPEYFSAGRIDLLIGVETYAQIILQGLIKGPSNAPIAQYTHLGWMLSGGCNDIQPSQCFHVTAEADDSITQIDNRIRSIWEIEQLADAPSIKPEDQRALDHFSATTVINPSGRYMVRLPFKSNPQSENFLGESYHAAHVRLKSMLHKFTKNEQFKKNYEGSINSSIEAGYIRPATPAEIADKKNCYFMPHHAVVKESSTTTKMRLVFDASCKSANGASLNDRLLTGPTLQSDLFTIILRWRKFPIAFLTDITKMYLQFQMHPEDAKFQRILWSVNGEIKQFVSDTITFGTASAPFQAIRILYAIADQCEKFAPLAADLLRHHFYVDDCAGGADTVEEAVAKYNQITLQLEKHGLNLRKWTSNNSEFLNFIPIEHQETTGVADLTKKSTIKALGLHWDGHKDSFSYSLKLPNRSNTTKRTFLSDYSMLFDPLGWLGPALVLMSYHPT